jgi:hypothetical protein
MRTITQIGEEVHTPTAPSASAEAISNESFSPQAEIGYSEAAAQLGMQVKTMKRWFDYIVPRHDATKGFLSAQEFERLRQMIEFNRINPHSPEFSRKKIRWLQIKKLWDARLRAEGIQ